MVGELELEEGQPRTSSCCFKLKASARSMSFSRWSFSLCNFSRWVSSCAWESSLSNLWGA